MKIEKTVCPYCGASMKILPGQEHAECEYCGSSVVISGAQSERQKESPSDNPRTAAQRNEEHTRTEPVRHAIFPPPGFRSRNILHMIIAVCGYLFIVAIAMSLGSAVDFVFFVAASLSVIDICWDWTGLWSRLKGIHSENRALRIAAKLIWSTVIFFIWIVLMVLVEDVVGI